MSFKNLEDRFNSSVTRLYDGAKTKFDGGRPSTGKNDDPLITRSPGNGYWGAGEGRGLPIRSSIEDIKRLTLFTMSTRGLLFMAKQQLLQTGNTFESQRILNPGFVIENSVPFVHVRRALDMSNPLKDLARQFLGNGSLADMVLGKDESDFTVTNLRKIGQLQSETYNNLARNPFSPVKSLFERIPVVSQILSAFTSKKSVGDDGSLTYENRRPELLYYVSAQQNKDGALFKFGGSIDKATRYGPKPSAGTLYYFDTYLKNDSRNESSTVVLDFLSNYNWITRSFYKVPKDQVTSIARSDIAVKDDLKTKYEAGEYDKAIIDNQNKYLDYSGDGTATFRDTPYIKYFGTHEDGGPIEGKVIVDDNGIASQKTADADGVSYTKKKLKYLRDDLNRPVDDPSAKVLSSYKNLKTIVDGKPDVQLGNYEDPIVVSFAMGKNSHIQFRAFISDIQQSANPEYKVHQYIGRNEKFISYVSVQREVGFRLGVLAFSKDELGIVWKRINYLTGMVFPYSFNKGILQPNIIRMTIGNMYVDQPGYVTSLETNFKELAESWDIDRDKQIPISAMVNMRFALIEKATRVANSPFYGINENNPDFENSLNIPAPPLPTDIPGS